MNIESAFPSAYIKCSDLNGQDLTVTVDTVTVEELGDDRKPIIHFQDYEKGLALNKTNALEISNSYGPETTDWTGRPITLFPARTMFQGRQVDCIRVRVPTTSTQANGSGQPAMADTSPGTQRGYALELLDLLSTNNLLDAGGVIAARTAIRNATYPEQKVKEAVARWEEKLTVNNVSLPDTGVPAGTAQDDDLPF